MFPMEFFHTLSVTEDTLRILAGWRVILSQTVHEVQEGYMVKYGQAWKEKQKWKQRKLWDRGSELKYKLSEASETDLY